MANLSEDIESYDSAKLGDHRDKDEEKEKPANNGDGELKSVKIQITILCLTDLMRQADSLAPPTHPTSPEKKRLNPMLITEYVQNIPPSTNLVAIISDMVAIQMQTDH